jgi:hypothetical protein
MKDIERLSQAKYIEVDAEVRYWEDASFNGQEDTEGKLVPFRHKDCWTPAIRLTDGQIINWPEGLEASIHYKVCDAGLYWLSNEDGRIAKWAGYYVPDEFLCHGSRGHGDYIIFKVGADGKIINYRQPSVELADDDEDCQEGWRLLEQ